MYTISYVISLMIAKLSTIGSDVAPKASSTRFVASVWYLFTLILVSSYTANLAAFLTVKRMESPIKSADDLANQGAIPYGTLLRGSTNNFFKTSNITTYKRMWAFMSANADKVLMSSSAAGFEKVKNSDYAFLAESTTIDYQVQRNCDLMQIGNLLDSKGYGLAAPKESPYIKYISKEIVYLQEKQYISKLYTKWWKEKSTIQCEEDDKSKINSMALDFDNVGGVFILLLGGSFAGLIIAFFEFLWKVWKNARVDKQSFLSEMSEELRFILRCKSKRTESRPSNRVTMDNGVQFSAINNTNIRNGR